VTGCAFCDIVRGGTPAHLVFEDDLTVAFLDHRPLFPGHVLLVPREHVETLGDVSDALAGPLLCNTRRLAVAVESAMLAEGTFVAMNNRVSQSVPHLHIHIVSRRRKDGLRGFFWPRNSYKNEEEAGLVREAIRLKLGEDAP